MASAAGANEISAVFSKQVLLLQPLAATAPDETHAAIVVSREVFSDFEFCADFVTLTQLRKNSPPNPWETAWAVFAYTDDNHFYYMAFKTNGWELGKVDPAYPGGQRFLADDTTVDPR